MKQELGSGKPATIPLSEELRDAIEKAVDAHPERVSIAEWIRRAAAYCIKNGVRLDA